MSEAPSFIAPAHSTLDHEQRQEIIAIAERSHSHATQTHGQQVPVAGGHISGTQHHNQTQTQTHAVASALGTGAGVGGHAASHTSQAQRDTIGEGGSVYSTHTGRAGTYEGETGRHPIYDSHTSTVGNAPGSNTSAGIGRGSDLVGEGGSTISSHTGHAGAYHGEGARHPILDSHTSRVGAAPSSGTAAFTTTAGGQDLVGEGGSTISSHTGHAGPYQGSSAKQPILDSHSSIVGGNQPSSAYRAPGTGERDVIGEGGSVISSHTGHAAAFERNDPPSTYRAPGAGERDVIGEGGSVISAHTGHPASYDRKEPPSSYKPPGIGERDVIGEGGSVISSHTGHAASYDRIDQDLQNAHSGPPTGLSASGGGVAAELREGLGSNRMTGRALHTSTHGNPTAVGQGAHTAGVRSGNDTSGVTGSGVALGAGTSAVGAGAVGATALGSHHTSDTGATHGAQQSAASHGSKAMSLQDELQQRAEKAGTDATGFGTSGDR